MIFSVYCAIFHVVFECPEYEAARSSGIVSQLIRDRNVDIFLLHRGRWSWAELNAIRKFFVALVGIRFAGGGGAAQMAKLNGLALDLWDA